ncbi:MAG: hypothetical protein IAG13_13545 [Deltaproteobacteria bacterium]|nr:hypothetical protein [Nannocystaceae bacterium]
MLQSEASVVVMFGDWPPTGRDSLGDETWNIDAACIYVGPSPLLTGILLSCDDGGVERQVDVQYTFNPPFGAPMHLPPMDVGNPLSLRAHTGFGETWLILSTPDGKIQVLEIVGTPQATLAEQSDYAPFEFEVQNGLCPVNGCVRRLGLDISVAGDTTRVFEGLPTDIDGEDGIPYVVFVEDLFESVASVDPACVARESIYLVVLAEE